MGERKVINKYYPPDFDPEAVSKFRRPKEKQTKVRLMLPMSIRCSTCGNFVYRGTKFNAKKETAEGEDYLGIRIFRFYFNCPNCSATLVMKTDPKNSDYLMETGATRNNDPWKPTQEEREMEENMLDEDDMDKMELLEMKTDKLKAENDILSALDEMKTLRAHQEKADLSTVLSTVHRDMAKPEDSSNTEMEEEMHEMKRFREEQDRQHLENKSSREDALEPLAKRARDEQKVQGWLGGSREMKGRGTDKTKARAVAIRKMVLIDGDVVGNAKDPERASIEGKARASTLTVGTLDAINGYGSDESGE